MSTNVFIAKFLDTARVKHELDTDGDAYLDFARKVEKLKPGECVRLRWTTQCLRSQKPNRLFIVKFWVTPFGTRKVRLQEHKISDSGHVGPRRINFERHNGRLVER